MFALNLSRRQLTHLLPKGGEIAEVGVAFGVYSEELWSLLQPTKMHLIDAWTAPTDPELVAKPYFMPQEGYDSWLSQVQVKFAGQTGKGHVAIHKGFSDDVLPTLDENSLDLIYLDAAHDFEGVTKDLINADRIVKEDGFIIGHDYSNSEISRSLDYAVIEAVNAFVLDHGYSLLAITLEDEPSFVIVRDKTSLPAQTFITKMVINDPNLMSFPDYPAKGRFSQELFRKGDEVYIVPEFRS